MHFGEDCLPEAMLSAGVFLYLLALPVRLVLPAELPYIELDVGPHERAPLVADDGAVSV